MFIKRKKNCKSGIKAKETYRCRHRDDDDDDDDDLVDLLPIVTNEDTFMLWADAPAVVADWTVT
jgi:hypothetical protein